MKKTILVTAFLIVLVLAGVIALHNKQQTQPSLGNGITNTGTNIDLEKRDVAPSIPGAAAQVPAPQPTPKSLQASFNSASSLYAFANYAKQFPEQGGILYAYSLARTCSNFLGSLTNKPAEVAGERDDPAVVAKRLAAVSKIYQKCDGFAADTTKDPMLKDVYANIKTANNDPYMSASADPAAAIKLLGTTRDSYLLETLLAAAIPPANGTNEQGNYFGGTLLTGVDSELLGMARGLAACKLGAGCNATEDLELIQNCAFGGICADNREALYKQMIANSNIKGGEEKLLLYRDKIIKAVNDHDSSMFTAKH